MSKYLVIANLQVEEITELSLDELCSLCQVSPDLIREMVQYGVIDMEEELLESYNFSLSELQRVRTAIHLQRDLDINFAGAALVCDLLDEVEALRTKIDWLEKHFQR